MSTELIGIGLGSAAAIGQAIYGQQQAQENQQQQVKDQRELMELGNNLAYHNWIRTNYPAQVEQMKKAGLNVGMMYGKGGGAGGTLQGSSGSASKADTIPMDISNAITQNRAIESQIEVNKAQANALNADADKKRGVDTDLGRANIANLNANTGNIDADTIIKNLQATGLEIDNYIKNNSADFEISQAEYLSGKLNEEWKNLEITNYKDRSTAETAIKQAKADLASTYLEQEATRVGIKLTKEQTRAISVELAQGWEELSLKHDTNVNQMNANQIKLLETKIYKALGEEANELTRRGQNLQLMQNVGNILKGNKTTKKGYSDTKGRYEETIETK